MARTDTSTGPPRGESQSVRRARRGAPAGATPPHASVPSLSEPLRDDGLSLGQLWGTAWVLGLISVGSLVRLAQYAAETSRIQTEFLVWAGVAAVSGAFSAACAVLVGLRAVEARLSAKHRYQHVSRADHHGRVS